MKLGNVVDWSDPGDIYAFISEMHQYYRDSALWSDRNYIRLRMGVDTDVESVSELKSMIISKIPNDALLELNYGDDFAADNFHFDLRTAKTALTIKVKF